MPYFYLRNQQGDVVAIHDAAGNVVARYAYDAWGNQLTEQIPDSIGEINPIRYRGYYFDNETGFYYCQSRYYNPTWCRWISADVYMDTGDGIMGTNMYAYCNNDPVNGFDPSGYKSKKTKLTLYASPIDFKDFNVLASLYLDKYAFFDVKDYIETLKVETSLLSEEFDIVFGRVSFQAEGYEWSFDFLYGTPANLHEFSSLANERDHNYMGENATAGLTNEDYVIGAGQFLGAIGSRFLRMIFGREYRVLEAYSLRTYGNTGFLFIPTTKIKGKKIK